LLYQRRQYGAAVFGAIFRLFKRWVLYTATIAHLDFIAILLLVASLGPFHKHCWPALFLLSLSPGVKQIAIFLVPLYLIWTWQAAERNKPREVLLAALVIASVPVVSALPFVAWNAEGFAKSIILSLTRVFDASYAEPSVDVRLGWTGIPARLPLLGLVPLVYWITWRRKIGMYTSVLL
jgi:Gpi18-like mannosyltransferase